MKKNYPMQVFCFCATLIFTSISINALAQIIPRVTRNAYQAKLSVDKRIDNFIIDEHRNTPSSIVLSNNIIVSQNTALAFLKEALQLRETVDELQERPGVNTMGGHINFLKYQQYYKGIKVEHGSYTAMSKDGVLKNLMGEFYSLDFSAEELTPKLSEAIALQKALDYVGAEKYMWQEPGMDKLPDGQKPTGELVIVEDIFGSKGMRLAYKFNIYASQPVSRSFMYVDALDGTIVFINRIIKHVNNTGTAATKYSGTQSITTSTIGSAGASPYLLTGTKNGDSINTYNMIKGTNYSAAVGFSDADNNWTAAEYANANYDNAALDAHWGASVVSDYWQNVQGRNSYNNLGGALKSYVHYSSAYNNAYWNGTGMTYGDGSNSAGGFTALTALDVCAHEIGHAVCDYLVASPNGLAYQRESGALNEGFSDIWGAAVEYYGAPTKKTWLIGEDIVFGGNGSTALRNMGTPKDGSQPDTYLGTNWHDVTPAGCVTPDDNTNDNCGVHYNSGVINKWFYLITVGGSGTNDIGSVYSLSGLTMAESQLIAYNTESLLSANSNYAACRTAAINATTTLYGACSNEVQVVTNAWYAVGVGNAFVQCGTNVNFAQTNASQTENAAGTVSGCRKYTDYTYQMVMGAAPSAAATATLVISGTASLGVDYDVTTNGSFTSPSNSLTFTTGSTAAQNFIVRVYDDATVESAETVIINYTLNNNGGNATTGTTIPTFTLTLQDNDTEPSGVISNTYSIGTSAGTVTAAPFDATLQSQRSQFLYKASELTTAGFVAGNIISLQLFIASKVTTRPFTNFSIKMVPTTTTYLVNGSVSQLTGLTTVFSTASYTTIAGWNSFNFATPFVWDGIKNIGIEICYDNVTASTTSGADAISLYSDGGTASQGNFMFQNSINCTQSFTSVTYYNTGYKPIIKLGLFAGTSIATATSSTSSNYLGVGSNDYLYSSDNKLIAKIGSINNTLNCTSVNIEEAGTTWVTYQGGQRSAKVFLVTPTTNGSTTSYTASFYFDNIELGGKSANTLKLLKTSAASAATSNSSNTIQVTPTISTLGSNTTIYTATFTGFSRFFLADANVVLPITLLDFTGKFNYDHNTQLTWITSNEYNNKVFEIEISRNGTDFVTLGKESSKGNSTAQQSYSYLHVKPQSGTTYYRLKQTDFDGKSTYSKIIVVNIADNGTEIPSLYPVPAHNLITINFGGIVSKGEITIYSSDMKTLLSQTVSTASIKKDVDISNLPNGIYFVKVIGGTNAGLLKFIKE